MTDVPPGSGGSVNPTRALDLPAMATPGSDVPADSTPTLRLRTPVRDRDQEFRGTLDELVPPDSQVRVVWELVARLDLTPWLVGIKAVEGRPGRDANDPRLLIALWIYATIKGIGSARTLAQWCLKHIEFRWLCGGVGMNHSTLAEFRRQGGENWDQLLTEVVAALMKEGLVSLDRVAQDGMKVRASAGKSSFRRAGRLGEFEAQAREQVDALKRGVDEDPGAASRREQAARARAAREKLERLGQALENCQEVQAQREAQAKQSGRATTEARASTTDPEARVMKTADGGYRPAYNVQFSTAVGSGLIVGVEVTNAGTDGEEAPPMLDQIEARYGQVPKEALLDGGFATKGTIEAAAAKGCTVYAPLKDEEKQTKSGQDPYAPKKGDSPALSEWRRRMGTAAAKELYKLRGQTAEWVNAICRNHGLWQMPVRGQSRCRVVALLHAITHNLMRGHALRIQAALLTATTQGRN
jgi:transposase